MKEKIMLFVIGVLVGATIATGAFYIYSTTNKTNNTQMNGGEPPSMPNNQNNANGQPPSMPNGEQPGMPNSNNQSSN